MTHHIRGTVPSPRGRSAGHVHPGVSVGRRLRWPLMNRVTRVLRGTHCGGRPGGWAKVIWDGRSRRWEGFVLASVYGLMVIAYFFA